MYSPVSVHESLSLSEHDAPSPLSGYLKTLMSEALDGAAGRNGGPIGAKESEKKRHKQRKDCRSLKLLVTRTKPAFVRPSQS